MSKLNILLQNKDLTERQYRTAEEMNKALTKSSRINRNLYYRQKLIKASLIAAKL